MKSVPFQSFFVLLSLRGVVIGGSRASIAWHDVTRKVAVQKRENILYIS